VVASAAAAVAVAMPLDDDSHHFAMVQIHHCHL
jgi:hypothetical protein